MIFGDLIPVCCMNRQAMKWKLYKYWGKFHEEEDNSCMHCGRPAYRRYEKRYNGYVGFCTYCDVTWPES
jgi:hypothetical protein